MSETRAYVIEIILHSTTYVQATTLAEQIKLELDLGDDYDLSVFRYVPLKKI